MARRLRPLVVLLPLALLLLLPTTAAVDYTGPGQTGRVPVGEGGQTIALLSGTADDRLFSALAPVPADTCRLVLDQNGTYGETRLTWAPGDETAYVWADVGVRDAPYRLHAAWQRDINGACTVETTEDQTYWHDPRGRPYAELNIAGHKQVQRGDAGTTIPIAFDVRNNGTIEAVVTARVTVMNEAFRATSDGPVVDVPIEAGNATRFGFGVAVPVAAQPGTYVIQVTFSAEDGWSQGATAILEVRPPAGGVPEPDPTFDPADASPRPPPTVAPREAPAAPVLLVLLVVLASGLRRRVG